MDDDKTPFPSGPDGGGFWWTVEFGLAASENRAWDEERLTDLAALSGALGSELLDEADSVVLRADYRATGDIGGLLRNLRGLAGSFEGVELRRHYKTESRPWHTQHIDAFPPLDVGRSLAVMAPWHKGSGAVGRIPIYIYPASAFGTGYHESTRIALELMEPAIRRDSVVIDVGTGSGILFIAALKLGAARALARDLDPAVMSEVRRNMELNELAPGLCDLAVGNLLDGVEARGNIVTANILLAPNLTLLPEVRRVLEPEGRAVFSGMTETERAVFLPALAPAGLALEREHRIGGWWGCMARMG